MRTHGINQKATLKLEWSLILGACGEWWPKMKGGDCTTGVEWKIRVFSACLPPCMQRGEGNSGDRGRVPTKPWALVLYIIGSPVPM